MDHIVKEVSFLHANEAVEVGRFTNINYPTPLGSSPPHHFMIYDIFIYFELSSNVGCFVGPL